jgi:hypothetical protein
MTISSYFDLSPRIVPARQTREITIRSPFGHRAFLPGETHTLHAYPMGGIPGNYGRGQPDELPFNIQENTLRFIYHFPIEQEYTFILERVGGSQPGWKAEFHIYALEPDLYTRRPFKGDMHMHTHYSDGKESPAYVAAACRRLGMDFIAITDHGQYEPSLEAIKAYQDAPIDLRIFPGEEVHPPDNPVHMLNIGGKFSVNSMFQSSDYRQHVQALQEQLSNLPPGVDPYFFASCTWTFDHIRQADGLGVFCHPYWIYGNKYNVPAALTDSLFERQPFDAYELIGGYHRHEFDSNKLQVARYQEERIKGKRLPIIGVSDSHGVERDELAGWYYTILFAPSPELSDVIQGIKDLYSVAVEALPGETPRAYGPLRLVRYALFLLREIFPDHDELCREEGRLMLEYAAGNTNTASQLGIKRGRTTALYNHFWGQP